MVCELYLNKAVQNKLSVMIEMREQALLRMAIATERVVKKKISEKTS